MVGDGVAHAEMHSGYKKANTNDLQQLDLA